LLAFAVLAALTVGGQTTGFNAAVENWVYAHRSSGPTLVFKGLTAVGEWYGLIPIALVVLAIKQTRRVAIPAAAALFVSAGLNLVLKAIFAVPRPDGHRLIAESGYSFPSGHAQDSAALFATLAILAWAALGVSMWRRVIAILAVLLVAGIGFSRVYLGVHSPVDVVAGFAAGLAVAAAAVVVARWWAERRTTSSQ
jgi:undecaprenyl-diphosphatase